MPSSRLLPVALCAASLAGIVPLGCTAPADDDGSPSAPPTATADGGPAGSPSPTATVGPATSASPTGTPAPRTPAGATGTPIPPTPAGPTGTPALRTPAGATGTPIPLATPTAGGTPASYTPPASTGTPIPPATPSAAWTPSPFTPPGSTPTPIPLEAFDLSCVDAGLGDAVGEGVYTLTADGLGDDLFDLCDDGSGQDHDDFALAWQAPRAGSFDVVVHGSDAHPTVSVHLLYPHDACPGPQWGCGADWDGDGSAVVSLYAQWGDRFVFVVDGLPSRGASFTVDVLPLEVGFCQDGEDNDGDGATDCEDEDCINARGCAVEACDDGEDDDYDLLIDCRDPDCAGQGACGAEADPCVDVDLGSQLGEGLVQTSLRDAGDDFASPMLGEATLDLLVQWSPPRSSPYEITFTSAQTPLALSLFKRAAEGAPTCPGDLYNGYAAYQPGEPLYMVERLDAGEAITLLMEAVPGEGDGAISLSIRELEWECDDGQDNDLDGAMDCDDPDCGSHQICLFEDCGNGQDDDRDEAVDCRDPDCAGQGDCGPQAEACADVDLGSAVGSGVFAGTLAGQGDHFDTGCDQGFSPDLAFEWTAPATGIYRFGASQTANPWALSIYTWPPGEACPGLPYTCAPNHEGEPELVIDGAFSAGERLLIVMEALGPQGGPFSLDILPVE